MSHAPPRLTRFSIDAIVASTVCCPKNVARQPPMSCIRARFVLGSRTSLSAIVGMAKTYGDVGQGVGVRGSVSSDELECFAILGGGLRPLLSGFPKNVSRLLICVLEAGSWTSEMPTKPEPTDGYEPRMAARLTTSLP